MITDDAGGSTGKIRFKPLAAALQRLERLGFPTIRAITGEVAQW